MTSQRLSGCPVRRGAAGQLWTELEGLWSEVWALVGKRAAGLEGGCPRGPSSTPGRSGNFTGGILLTLKWHSQEDWEVFLEGHFQARLRVGWGEGSRVSSKQKNLSFILNLNWASHITSRPSGCVYDFPHPAPSSDGENTWDMSVRTSYFFGWRAPE